MTGRRARRQITESGLSVCVAGGKTTACLPDTRTDGPLPDPSSGQSSKQTIPYVFTTFYMYWIFESL